MKKTIITIVFSCLIVAYFVSCKKGGEKKENEDGKIEVDGTVPARQYLEQNWSDADRKSFWFTSQGSRIIPYSWFTWLEQPDNENLFRNTKHMEMLGYLPEKISAENPSGLPIGFTLTAAEQGEETMDFVGLTCAACHTNQIDFGDKKLLVEGAPTLANFVLFFHEVIDAMEKTAADEAKFERFAKKVLGDAYGEKTVGELKKEMAGQIEALRKRQAVNALPEGYPSDFTSYGRLDAFGEIENAGTAFALGHLDNKNAPTAPVSYPFLWGTHQSDVVQWNASASNRIPIVGPISRNVGEVVGVFGSLKIAQDANSPIGYKYTSTVDYHGIGVLEGYIKKLRSPRWPNEIFGAPDAAKVAQGKALFAKQCAGCHQVVSPEDEHLDYTANKTPIAKLGTDKEMAMQVAMHKAKTYILEGAKANILSGDVFGKEGASIRIAVNGATGLLLSNLWEVIKADAVTLEVGGEPYFDKTNPKMVKLRADVAQLFLDAEKHTGKKKHDIKVSELSPELALRVQGILMQAQTVTSETGVPNELVYKGRPLNGIWATAPFLHNGSVPNLWELLLAPEERTKSFWVGSRTFDAKNVGFVTTEGKNEFQVLKKGTQDIMPGNSNLGHDYGTKLSVADKWALIEYMKTL